MNQTIKSLKCEICKKISLVIHIQIKEKKRTICEDCVKQEAGEDLFGYYESVKQALIYYFNNESQLYELSQAFFRCKLCSAPLLASYTKNTKKISRKNYCGNHCKKEKLNENRN